jgi:GNAT superfamily N-acetyltransferase
VAVRFEPCDPQEPPAAELLAEMAQELNALYWTSSRLDLPPVHADELRPPDGIYLVAWQGARAVAGGAVRRMEADVGEIKRMFVRPDARSQGVAGALLAALEAGARSLGYRRVRLDTGPKQVHAISLYERAGYVPIDPYNENPFASFWGEKELEPFVD